jgi:hypothetical protein
VAERKCCDEIVAAQVAVDALESDALAWRKDAQIWRDGHEARNAEAFDRAFRLIEESNLALNKRLGGIEEKLNSRLPLWTTTMFTIGGATIGILVTIVVMLGNHFI